MANFFRVPTESERMDFTDIGPGKVKDAKSIFLEQMSKAREECTKKRLPFFKKAALDDFNEYFEQEVKRVMKLYHYVKIDEIKPFNADFSKYSSPDNIVLLSVDEVRDQYQSKQHPFDVFVKTFRYKYMGYGLADAPNMSVMEDTEFAVKRCQARYENKPMPTEMSPAENKSRLYSDLVSKSESRPEPKSLPDTDPDDLAAKKKK